MSEMQMLANGTVEAVLQQVAGAVPALCVAAALLLMAAWALAGLLSETA